MPGAKIATIQKITKPRNCKLQTRNKAAVSGCWRKTYAIAAINGGLNWLNLVMITASPMQLTAAKLAQYAG